MDSPPGLTDFKKPGHNRVNCTSLGKHLSKSFETLKEKTTKHYAKDI